MDFPSKLLENAVHQIAQLPGIGKRTALRLALHILKTPETYATDLGAALQNLRTSVVYCEGCHNISDQPLCEICSNPKRNSKLLCVVEDVRDVMAIENTNQYKGLYHVLGGLISPIDGVGPQDLNVASLIKKVASKTVEEVIFALSSTVEADTTNFYIFKQIESYGITTSTIARGIAVGDELEYADEVTLGRSILARIPFDNSIS
ncbi:MAG: recombination mediator RecR [Flavobacteriaceae bacterium]|jgi:recombination protein RecR